METALRIIEVSVYGLLHFLPFVTFAIYPFTDRLRFRKTTIVVMVVLLAGMDVAAGLLISFHPGSWVGLLSLLSTLLYALFYLSAMKVPFGKSIFTLLMISNVANYTVVASKCLEGVLFPALAVQQYRWSFSVTTVTVYLVLAAPLYLFFKKLYKPMMAKESDSLNWKYIWTIPAVFYCIWYYGLYVGSDMTALEVALQPSNTLYMSIVNIGAFVVYYVIAQTIKRQKIAEQLKLENMNLSVLASQYRTLNEKIAEARQLRHDVRHHIATMQNYLNREEYEKLKEYLANYEQSIPDNGAIAFCKNNTVNSVLMYFAYQAKANGIDYITKVNISEKTFVSDPDLSVIFGNLIENAISACISESSENKKIIICADETAGNLCLTVDNSFSGELKKADNGEYISTKHNGFGIGISSVKSIAQKYDGTVRIKNKDGMFMASVLLNLVD